MRGSKDAGERKVRNKFYNFNLDRKNRLIESREYNFQTNRKTIYSLLLFVRDMEQNILSTFKNILLFLLKEVSLREPFFVSEYIRYGKSINTSFREDRNANEDYVGHFYIGTRVNFRRPYGVRQFITS